jgi:hypothetical protein
MNQSAVNIINDHKNIPTFVTPRPSKMYPNYDVWYENIPAGNPELEA